MDRLLLKNGTITTLLNDDLEYMFPSFVDTNIIFLLEIKKGNLLLMKATKYYLTLRK